MYLQTLSEHQIHLFGGIIVLAVLFLGILGLVIYLDKRGVKTYVPRPEVTTRRERRMKKKLAKGKRKRAIKANISIWIA